MTDVTGFGLFGHGLEMARGSGLSLVVNADDVPLLNEAIRFAEQGFITGASARNWASYGEAVTLPSDFPEWRRSLFTDPQTSGGLLIACDPARAESVLDAIVAAGYPRARIIGHVENDGAPSIRLMA